MKYRRSLMGLALLILLVSCIAGSLMVHATVDITDLTSVTVLEAPEVLVRQDEDFDLVLSIPCLENMYITGFQLFLTYDPQLLTLDNVTNLSGITVNTETKGCINLSILVSNKIFFEKTDLVKLTFHVNNNAGIGSYDLLKLDETKSNIATVNLGEEIIKVKANIQIPDLVLYDMGDVSLDRSVDVGDASVLQQYLAGFSTLLNNTGKYTSENLLFRQRLADVEQDNKLNMQDVSRLLRRCALFMNDRYGDRVNIFFYDRDINLYTTRSVRYEEDLLRLPAIPYLGKNFSGQWSASPEEYVEPNLNNITKELNLYAVYTECNTDAIAFYKNELTKTCYTEDLHYNLSNNLTLADRIDYQDGYYATLRWSSSRNDIISIMDKVGVFQRPSFPTEVKLTAYMTCYNNKGRIEAEESITFVYQIPGYNTLPTKDEISPYLHQFFISENNKYLVNYNLQLPTFLSEEGFVAAGKSESQQKNFEVKLAWYQCITNADGSTEDVPIAKIIRTTQPRVMDLVAVATFNGAPLEGDGRITIPNVEITAVGKSEIKSHIIASIAEKLNPTMSDGDVLWTNDTLYHTTIEWSSKREDLATVVTDNHTALLAIDAEVINDTHIPLEVRVYTEDGKENPIILSYTITVTGQAQDYLIPGETVDSQLYSAITRELRDATGYDGELTAAALRAKEFVSLDLRSYPNIESLDALKYCENLISLNISGIKVKDNSISELSYLKQLRTLIARDCGLNDSHQFSSVLDHMKDLILLDLSHNQLTDLDTVFPSGRIYGQLRELYLNHNQLDNIAGLAQTPALSMLSLGSNKLESDDLVHLEGIPYLNYLSLANNRIGELSHLTHMSSLIELRLQGNEITDISPLAGMVHLRSLYLGHNRIRNVEALHSMVNLYVLYLNDNQIESISDLVSLTKLRAVNVSNNLLTDLDVLQSSRNTLTEIYAENNRIASFAFAEGMDNLWILMLAGNTPQGGATAETSLTSTLGTLEKMELLTLSGKPLQDLDFLLHMPKLFRLDIANCGLHSDHIEALATYSGELKILDISKNPLDSCIEKVKALASLTALTHFYANDICTGISVSDLVGNMKELRYLSMRNCGVTDLDWLNSRLIYVDLSGHAIKRINLDEVFSPENTGSLTYLYLDCEANVTMLTGSGNNSQNTIALEELSLAGLPLGSLDTLPKMDNLRYLDLTNTALPTDGLDSITRFPSLTTLVITDMDLVLTPLKNLEKLNTLYANGVLEYSTNYDTNLSALRDLYEKQVVSYPFSGLYVATSYIPGMEHFVSLEDLSCSVVVAADGMISDNNPVLLNEAAGYPITWTVSNSENYEIRNNRLAVKSYSNISDEALTLTASIRPYSDSDPVTLSFTVNTEILRINEENAALYCSADTTNFSSTIRAGTTFCYNVTLKEGSHPAFSVPVKPVVDEILYSYRLVSKDGKQLNFLDVFTGKTDGTYTIRHDAPVDAVVTLLIDMCHTEDGKKVIDYTIGEDNTVQFKILSPLGDKHKIIYAPNGGTVTEDGVVLEPDVPIKALELILGKITREKRAGEALFVNMTVSRTFYRFTGWYTDAMLTKLFWKPGDATVYMPDHDLTLYAGWEAVSDSVILYLHPNGGWGEVTHLAKCNTPIGTLHTPQRAGYTFLGWYTSETGGTLVTASTVYTKPGEYHLYAHWKQN